MANFVATLSKLTGFADYLFWEICVKSTLALITYSGAIFIAKDMLNALALPFTCYDQYLMNTAWSRAEGDDDMIGCIVGSLSQCLM